MIRDNICNKWFEEFMFKENWLEVPFYFNNPEKTLRFDLESMGELESKELVDKILSEVFVEDSYMYFADTKPISGLRIHVYFKVAKRKHVIKFNTREPYVNDENSYVNLFVTRARYFKKKKFIQDYLNDEGPGWSTFISAKKRVALNFYDARGFDIFSTDSVFLKRIENKYKKYLYDFSKDDIEE